MKSRFAPGPMLALALALPLTSIAFADTGKDTAAAMQAYYDATPEHCNQTDAYRCSGILLRTTKASATEEYYAWNNSKDALARKGVSFTYLRADLGINDLGGSARSGYSLAPLNHLPAGTMPYIPACAFPTDGDTQHRDKFGCGDNLDTVGIKENLCERVGVQTAEQWVERYQQSPRPKSENSWTDNDKDNRYITQCAFNISDDKNQGRNFNEALRASALMPTRPFPWNEVIVKLWDETRFKELPIQSFFYLANHSGAKADAQLMQQQWHAKGGRFVPVIRLQLEGDSRKTRFVYDPADQKVSPRG
ncbi:hypothetical protein [Pseudomonas putida]